MSFLLQVAVLTGVVLALAVRGWFALWVFAMLLIATNSSARLFRGDRRLQPWRPALLLLVIGVSGGIIGITRLANIADGDRFDYLGVYLRHGDRPLTVGAGLAADIRLEASRDDADGWRLGFTSGDSGYSLTSVEGAAWVEGVLPGQSYFRSRSVLLWGTELGPGDSVEFTTPAGARAKVQLVRLGYLGVGLRIGRDTLRLDRSDLPDGMKRRALEERLRGALANGLVLRDFPPARGVVPDLTDDMILVQVRPPQVLRMFQRPRLRIGFTKPGFSTDRPTGRSRVLPGMTVRVTSGDRAWRFRLAPDVGPTGRRGTRLYFVSRPDSSVSPLPGAVACPPRVACGIISNRALPPPVAFISLSHAGVDSTRYDLLARIERSGREARLIRLNAQPGRLQHSIPLRLGERTDLPLDAPETAPPAGVIVQLRNVSELGTEFYKRIVQVLAVLVIWSTAAFVLLRSNPVRWVLGLPRTWVEHGHPQSRPHNFPDTEERRTARAAFWSVLYGILILASLRLVLGYRATMAEPNSSRGDITALGLWLALPLTALMVGFTPLLVPWLTRITLPRLRQWLFGQIQGMARPSMGVVAVAVLVLAVLFLVSSSLAAAKGAVVVSLAAWAIAVLTPLAFPYRAEDTSAPGQVVLAEPGRGWMIATGMLFACLQLPIIPGKLWPPIFLAGAVLFILTHRMRRRPFNRHWAALGLLLSVAVLIRSTTDGPVPIFMAVLLLLHESSRCGLGERAPRDSGDVKRVLAQLGTILVPLLPIIPLTLIDFGLGLMCVIPLVLTATLGADITRSTRATALVLIVTMALVGTVARPILFPDHSQLDRATTPAAVAAAFEDLGGTPGKVLRWAGVEDKIARPMIRSLAARDPEGLERALALAGPSAYRSEILRSIEQAWGGRVYAAQGWRGVGLGNAPVPGQGIPRPTAPAENTYAAFILAEHGAAGGLATIAAYAYFLIVAIAWLLRSGRGGQYEQLVTARALVTGSALLLAFPATYVALSNLGEVPLTGQNMPFLGLNAWSDVLFAAGLATTMLFALAGLCPRELQDGTGVHQQ